MIEDIEALEDISERVLHRIQILKSLQPQFHTKRPLPNSSTISTAPLTSPFSPQSKRNPPFIHIILITYSYKPTINLFV